MDAISKGGMEAAPLMKSQLSDGKGKHFNGQYVTVTQSAETDRKNTKHISDCRMVHDYFLKNPATMFQCEVDTGCPRPYVCWYVRSMRQNGDIQIFKYGRCPISGCDGVQYLTTNKSLFKEDIKQPNLFDGLWEST